jgi:hypothetical protein
MIGRVKAEAALEGCIYAPYWQESQIYAHYPQYFGYRERIYALHHHLQALREHSLEELKEVEHL